MGTKSSLTEVRWAQIVTLHGYVYTGRDIAAKLRCSKTAVHNAIVKSNAGGTLHDGEKVWSSTENYAQGRPLSEANSNALAMELLQENLCYFTQYVPVLFEDVSDKTCGLNSQRPALKLRLTPVKRYLTLPDVIAIGLSLSGRKCCFLNAPCSSLYLTTCTLGDYWVSVLTRHML